MPHPDLAIIGGGILGLATAYQFTQRYPDLKVTVLEKESDIALHQTGHNSGVLHSGIYYKPGSLKAENCRAGKQALEQFCIAQQIPFERCGKVIVAVSEDEIPQLEQIFERGQANGVACEMIDAVRLNSLEPHTAGIQAIYVPEAGIINYSRVCHALRQCIEAAGNTVLPGFEVNAIYASAENIALDSTTERIYAQYAINCTGLYADKIARMAGVQHDIQIVPFRGEYYTLTPDAYHLCRALIYPVPDPDFPFLGVHFTKMIEGGIECGPNAVLALAREGYTRTSMKPAEMMETVTYSGFRKLAKRHWRQGMGEFWRSFSKQAFVKALQRLVPEIRASHLIPAPAGVRAQALSSDGKLIDDFLILESERMIHVCNAPSPAATASLNIGNTIVDRLRDGVMEF